MKKIGLLLTLVLLAAACETPQEEILSFSITPDIMGFDAQDNSTKLFTINSNGDWSVVLTDAKWVHLDKTAGSGNGTIAVTVDANDSFYARSTSFKILVKSARGQEGMHGMTVTQRGNEVTPVTPAPAPFDGKKRASTTYQLLIYSFADSNGDGVGDFKGIQNKLDYLDDLGVTALWLSPAHPADSYHGYDVTDYFAVNSLYGTEEDFRQLVEAAHAKGIKIYMDYVLNHSGKGHPWFKEALADPSSKYRDYYFISANPKVDYSKFAMLKGTTYKAEEWKAVTSGSPKLKITKTDEAVTKGGSTWNLYTWKDGEDAKEIQFVDKGDGTLYLVADFSGKCGILIRKYMNWDAGSKFGAKDGNTTLSVGKEMELVADGADISFTGTGRYKLELTNISTETLYFMGAFGDWMPDLNYGNIDDVQNNATFKELAASADKWINLGIDGFRLDAVKHICGGINSYNNSANRKFLKAWYDHCNATYKAAGHTDDIFMVGEVWDNHASVEKYYYEGLTSCFEFGYWPVLYRALTTGNASSYVSSVTGFLNDHKTVRPDAQTSFFMTNHDHSSQTGDGEVRAADDLGKDPVKEKQAAAMLLTSGGKPFIYQGEELGYWGNSKNRGDEYLRAPILWDKAGKDCAKKGVNNKVDNSMLTATISVEYQSAEKESLLNVYRTWSRLRNTYPALAEGEMSATSLNAGNSVASWYMTASNGQKLLVIHNCSGSFKTMSVSDDVSKPVGLLGEATVSGKDLTLDAHSSVVFELN